MATKKKKVPVVKKKVIKRKVTPKKKPLTRKKKVPETKAPVVEDTSKPQIGSVGDAINTKAAPNEAIKEHKVETKEAQDKKKDAPITTLAQLRDWHLSKGTEPTTEELDKVKELEAKVAEEGKDKARVSAQKASK